jgi:hypothetical protein
MTPLASTTIGFSRLAPIEAAGQIILAERLEEYRS